MKAARLVRFASLAAADPAEAARRVRRRLAGSPRISTRAFGQFERDDGTSVALLDGYRDLMKGGWRDYWWQARLLLELAERDALPAELEPLVAELRGARTLPFPVAEFEAAARSLAGSPLVVAAGERLVVVPTEIQLQKWEQSYRFAAGDMLTQVGPVQRALEIGCGTGFMSLAVAASGVPEVVACDRKIETYGGAAEGRALLAERLVPPGSTVEFVAADAAALPYPDASFDLVFSHSVVEHLSDPAAVFRELRRVLRPGGYAYHGVDPWFSPQGGHTMCILDFPWGHARLSAGEFERYVQTVRPHEAVEAVRAWSEDFQVPRLSLSDLNAVVAETGFETLALGWRSSSTARSHSRFATAALLREVKAAHPHVERPDLFTDGVSLLCR